METRHSPGFGGVLVGTSFACTREHWQDTASRGRQSTASKWQSWAQQDIASWWLLTGQRLWGAGIRDTQAHSESGLSAARGRLLAAPITPRLCPPWGLSFISGLPRKGGGILCRHQVLH